MLEKKWKEVSSGGENFKAVVEKVLEHVLRGKEKSGSKCSVAWPMWYGK